MDNEKDIEFIDNFLAGKLNSQELEDFNKRLLEDPEFKKEYELLSAISAAFQRIKLKDELADLESKISQEEKTKDDSQDVFSIEDASRFSLSKRLAIAATIATIILSAYFIYQNNNQTDKIPLGSEEVEEPKNDTTEILKQDSLKKDILDFLDK